MQLATAFPGKLKEPQTVCYELLKALKSYLVLIRRSSFWDDNSYDPDQLIFNFLKRPDFLSNFFATKEEADKQMTGALASSKTSV